MISFIKLYSFEFAGIIPSFITGDDKTNLLSTCPSIVSPSIQVRFVPIVESFYSSLLQRVFFILHWFHF